MGYKAIICNQARFDELNALALSYVQAEFGCKSKKWCNILIHPVDGRIALTVKDRILPILTGETIIELTPDWFTPYEE